MKIVVEDPAAPVSDETLQAAILDMLALVQGLESCRHHCPCGRYYRLGVSDELQATLITIRRAIFQRTGEDPLPNTGRFSLLEID